MAQIQVSTLLQRVEDAVDMENFVDQAVLLRWLNAIYPRFKSKLLRMGWAAPIETINLSTGSGSYGLEVLAVVGVYMKDGSSYRKLRPIYHDSKPSTETGTPEAFRVTFLEGAAFRIDLFPEPAPGTFDSQTFLMDYVAAHTPLAVTAGAGLATSLLMPNGWEEWLVLQLARKCLAREETINPAIENEFERVEKDIEQQIRDHVWASARIRNTDTAYEDASNPSDWIWS